MTRLLSEEQLGLEPDSGPGCEIGIKLKTWNGKARRSESGLVWLHSPWVLPTFCRSSALSSVCMAMISSERALLDRVDQASHTEPLLPTIHATGPCDLCFSPQRTWSGEHPQQSQPGQGELHQGSLGESLRLLVAQTVKSLPAMRETRVQSLGGEEPLEKEMVAQSSILAWKLPQREKPGRLQSMGSPRVRHDLVTKPIVAQLCSTLWDLLGYSPPGSSVHGIFQARILQWVAISFSRRSS